MIHLSAVYSEATLGSRGDMTIFSFGNHVIRFKTSPHLKRYEAVKEWDNGYIVCTAVYDNSDAVEEEYIDLIPILKNLYMDPDVLLKPIRKVKVDNSLCV